MNPVPLMQVALESIVFLGLSTEETVAPDAAVSQLEAIGSLLQEMPLIDRQAFLVFVQGVADMEESGSGIPERIEFLRHLGENLGIS